jgi:hypothetical protein
LWWWSSGKINVSAERDRVTPEADPTVTIRLPHRQPEHRLVAEIVLDPTGVGSVRASVARAHVAIGVGSPAIGRGVPGVARSVSRATAEKIRNHQDQAERSQKREPNVRHDGRYDVSLPFARSMSPAGLETGLKTGFETGH